MHAQLIKCNKILIVCNLSYSNFYQNHDYAVSFFHISGPVPTPNCGRTWTRAKG